MTIVYNIKKLAEYYISNLQAVKQHTNTRIYLSNIL